jgi:hypothetical protein
MNSEAKRNVPLHSNPASAPIQYTCRRAWRVLSGITFAALLACFLPFTEASSNRANQPVESIPANERLRQVIDNEIKLQDADHSHWKYKSDTANPKKVKWVVQTKDGEIDGLVAIDNRPLTDAERESEIERIERFVKDRTSRGGHRRAEQEDSNQAEHMLKVLPDAVLATYGERNGDLLQFHFKPNPSFRPSTREDQVFHAMEGTIVVNVRENRLAEIEGRLTQPVKFAYGLLGHLDAGGEFHVKQTEVAPGHWEITFMHVAMTGRVLFFKTISVHEDESRSDFQQVPNTLTLAQAAADLRRQICSGACA